MKEPEKRVQDASAALSDAVAMLHTELQQLPHRRMKVGERLAHLTRLAHAMAQCTSTLGRVSEAHEFERRLDDLEHRLRTPATPPMDGLDLDQLGEDDARTLLDLVRRAQPDRPGPRGNA